MKALSKHTAAVVVPGVLGYCLYRSGTVFLYNEGMGFLDAAGGFVSGIWFVYAVNACTCLIALMLQSETPFKRTIAPGTLSWIATACMTLGVVAGLLCDRSQIPTETSQIITGSLCGASITSFKLAWFGYFTSRTNGMGSVYQIVAGYLLAALLCAAIELIPQEARPAVSIACLLGSSGLLATAKPGPDENGLRPFSFSDGECKSMASISLCFFVLVAVTGLLHTSVLGSTYSPLIADVPMRLAHVITGLLLPFIALGMNRNPGFAKLFRIAFPVVIAALSLLPFLETPYGFFASSIVIVGYNLCSITLFLFLVWDLRRANVYFWRPACLYMFGSSAALLAGLAAGQLLQSLSVWLGVSLVTMLAFAAIYPLIMAARMLPSKKKSRNEKASGSQSSVCGSTEVTPSKPSRGTSNPEQQPCDGKTSEKILIHKAAHAIASRCDLTEREEEILEYLAKGRSAKYIAEQLVISENTAWTHIKRIYAKTGIHNRQELMSHVENLMEHSSNEEPNDVV